MCNKCEAPSTPLLTMWAQWSHHTYRNATIREFMKEQHLTENRKYWSHARRHWVMDEKPQKQQNGHAFAKQKAIAHKVASREATTLVDANVVSFYLKTLNDINRYIAEKLEPSFVSTMNKQRDGTWEPIDVMNKLHPYLHNQGSSHDAYATSQQGFHTLNRLHNIHLSTEDINQIAYYPTLKHMREGREVRTKLGRYLTKYQQALSLSESDIKNMAEKHSANMRSRGGWTVDFIAHNDAQGWLTVYESPDVTSCMQNEDAVRIYAHERSVLRLAHVKAGDKIIARCIVREDDGAKGWLRVYPDPNGYAEGRYLLDYLKTNGYENQTNLDGALLQYIESGSNIVCPYLDYGNNGSQSVGVVMRDGVRYLEAGGSDYNATETNGYAQTNTTSCDICGDDVHEEEISHIEHDNNYVCEHCRDRHYTWAYGRRYEDYFPSDECIEVNGEWYWAETIDNHNIGRCDYSDDYCHTDELVETYDGVYHQDYVVSVDRHTDWEYVFQNKVHTLSDGTTCHEDDADKYQLEIDDLALDMVEANQE